MNDGIFSNSL